MKKELTNNIRKFIMAGNSTFTVKNDDTGNHVTFRVRKLDDKKKPIHFVSVKFGSSMLYIGTVFNYAKFVFSKKSALNNDSILVKGFEWVFNRANNLPKNVHIYHEGSCGRCGKQLTNPKSIESGYGPECIERV